MQAILVYLVLVLRRETFRKVWILFRSARGPLQSGHKCRVASFAFQADQACTKAQVTNYKADLQSNGVPATLSTAGLSCFCELINLPTCRARLEKVFRVQALG